MSELTIEQVAAQLHGDEIGDEGKQMAIEYRKFCGEQQNESRE